VSAGGRGRPVSVAGVAQIAAFEAVASVLDTPGRAELVAHELLDGCDSAGETRTAALALIDAALAAAAAPSSAAAAARLVELAARTADGLLEEAVGDRYACNVPTPTPAPAVAQRAAEGPRRRRIGRSAA
jgi:hypothetical protein